VYSRKEVDEERNTGNFVRQHKVTVSRQETLSDIESETEDEDEDEESHQTVNFNEDKAVKDLSKDFKKKVKFDEQTTRRSFANRSARPNREEGAKTPACQHCQGDHAIWMCPEFKGLKPGAKYEVVRSKRLCIHCLNPGHMMRDCPNQKGIKCGVDGCDKFHNKLLHVPKQTAMVSIEAYFEMLDGWGEESNVNPREVHLRLTTSHNTTNIQGEGEQMSQS
jgi:hypothetical protein